MLPIAAIHIRKCMQLGTCVQQGNGYFRYYYKRLVVVSKRVVVAHPFCTEEAVQEAFWLLQAYGRTHRDAALPFKPPRFQFQKEVKAMHKQAQCTLFMKRQ